MATAGLRIKGLKETQRKFRTFRTLIKRGNKPIMKKVGQKAIWIITLKTLSGLDYKDKPFVKYSRKYAKKKGNRRVDLTLSGEMIKALSYQEFSHKTRIYIKKTAHKGGLNSYNLAIIHNFGAKAGKDHTAKIPKREFVNLTEKDIIVLKKIVEDFYVGKLDEVFK